MLNPQKKFKIIHLPYANQMLILGMGTEALIFFMSAWENPPKNYKWERAYPGILDAEDAEELIVTLSEDDFNANPIKIGESITASWNKLDVIHFN